MNQYNFFNALLLLCVFILTPLVAQAQYVELDTITGSTVGGLSAFGTDISVSGEKALIASPGFPASAYMFEKSQGVWTETHVLSGNGDTGFGSKVALSGDRAVVSSQNAGVVYVYEFINDEWIETSRLTPDDVDPVDDFGASLSFSGDRLLVGTRESRNFSGTWTGSAYVFDFDGEAWVQTQKIHSPADSDGNFGHSVSLSGDRALIGAFESGLGGTAYVFELQEGNWVQTAELIDGGIDRDFGISVLLEGEQALIAATGTDITGTTIIHDDAVYLYELSDGLWTQTAKLTGMGNDEFGTSIARTADMIVVGAPQGGASFELGLVYIFKLVDGAWNHTVTLSRPNASSSERIGQAIGLAGDEILVGRNEHEIVYIFGPPDGDGDGYSDVDELACNSNPDDFDSVPSGIVSGAVTTGSNGIAGITVKVLDALDPMIVLASGTTDAQGDYSFADVPQGDVQVMVVEPLGFSSATNNVDEAVACNVTSTVDFSLDELILVNNAMRVSYWKHQFDLAVAGRPTSEDLTAIISEIENRFTDPHFNSLFAGMGDGVDDEQDWQALFSIRPSGGTFARARAQLAGVVVNVMAQKIAQLEVVTDDGRHVADVITYAAQLLEDADAGNDGTAYTVAEQVNRQLSIGAGVVPAGNVVYGQEDGRRGPALDAEAVAAALPETFALENNYPNPFNPTTAIRFALPETAQVSLVVYNTLGQTVATLVDGSFAAGRHEVQFDAGNLSSGTYFYLLETPEGSFSKTMLLLK